jgi:hypothetical protein
VGKVLERLGCNNSSSRRPRDGQACRAATVVGHTVDTMKLVPLHHVDGASKFPACSSATTGSFFSACRKWALKWKG